MSVGDIVLIGLLIVALLGVFALVRALRAIQQLRGEISQLRSDSERLLLRSTAELIRAMEEASRKKDEK